MNDNIEKQNKIPGSCEEFTRPEEISALGKYLKDLRGLNEAKAELEMKNLTPSKNNAKFNEIESLDDRLDVLAKKEDIDRLSKVREILSPKEDIINLPKERVNIESDNDDLILSEILKGVENNKQIDSLSSEVLEIKEDTDTLRLSKESIGINVVDNSELSKEKDKIQDTNETELSKSKLEIKTTEQSKLSDEIEKLKSTNDEQNLSKKKLEISTEEISVLGDIKENITGEVKDSTLSDIIGKIDVDEASELSEEKDKIQINEEISLGEHKDRLEIKENLELPEKPIEIKEPDKDLEGLEENTQKIIGSEKSIEELSGNIEKVGVEKDNTTLPNEKLKISDKSEVNFGVIEQRPLDKGEEWVEKDGLYDSNLIIPEVEDKVEPSDIIVGLKDIKEVGLSEEEKQKLIEIPKIKNLENQVQRLEKPLNIDLRKELLKLAAGKDQELSEKILQLTEIGEDSELGKFILKVKTKDIGNLDETIEKLTLEENNVLSEELLRLLVSDNDLSDILVKLDKEEEELTPSEHLEIIETENKKTELSDIIEEISGKKEINKTSEELLKLNIPEEKELSDFISNLEEEDEIDLSEDILSLNNIKIVDLSEETLNLAITDEEELSETKEKISEIKTIKELREYIEALKIEDQDKLSEYKEARVEDPENEWKESDGLYEASLGIDIKETEKLENNKELLTPTDTEELENNIEKVFGEHNEDIELGEEEIKLKPKEDIDLGETKLNIIDSELNKIAAQDLDDLKKALKERDLGHMDEYYKILMNFSESSLISSGWSSKIKGLMSSYLSGEINSSKMDEFLDKVYKLALEDYKTSPGSMKITVEDDIKIPNSTVMVPKYSLDLWKNGIDAMEQKNFSDVSNYIRWSAEKIVGNTKGALRMMLLDTTLWALCKARYAGEKAMKANRERLPGNDLGILSKFANGGIGDNLMETSANVTKDILSAAFKSGLSLDTSKPMNRPEKKEKYGEKFEETNTRPTESIPVEKDDGPSKWKKFGRNLIGKPGEKNYTFFNNYLQGAGIKTTMSELAGVLVDDGKFNSLEDLRNAIKNSQYMSCPERFTTTSDSYGVYTLDTNDHWEIIFEPYVGCLNGNRSFLPAFEEINEENRKKHGVVTGYSRWIPFAGFELSKSRLTSKNINLYDGEFSIPSGIEFTNELRLTIVDDQYKSWRRYFEKCMMVSVYSSNSHLASFYGQKNDEVGSNLELREDLAISNNTYYDEKLKSYYNVISSEMIYAGDTPTVIDKNYIAPAFYKNLAFRCIIYNLTPQYSTISRYDLLVVLKDFAEERSGEIEAGGSDLNITFSIVGENPVEVKNLPKTVDRSKSKFKKTIPSESKMAKVGKKIGLI